MKQDSTTEVRSWDARWQDSLRALHKRLFDPVGELKAQYSEIIDCPVCGSSSYTEYCIKDGFHYRSCKSCSMIYMSPRLNKDANHAFYNSEANEVYNETKFHAGKAGESADDKTNLANLKILQKHLQKHRQANGNKKLKLMEIGCAKGYFLQNARAAGFDVYGVELNEINVKIAKSSLGDDRIFDKDLFELDLPENSFDVIYTRDVIEHIYNPMEFLREVCRITRPGGMIFTETHNVGGLIHKIVGGRHTCFFGFEHPVHWSSKTLALALQKAGFQTNKVYFESEDFRILRIIHYFIASTFTTIFPWRAGPLKRWMLRLLSLPFRLPLIKDCDQLILPQLANRFKAGSTMKVVAFKPKF